MLGKEPTHRVVKTDIDKVHHMTHYHPYGNISPGSAFENVKINTEVFNPSVFPRFQVEKLLDLRRIRWLDVLWFQVAPCQQKLLKVLHVAAVPLRRCFVVDHWGWIILPDDTLGLLLHLQLKKIRCGSTHILLLSNLKRGFPR